MILRWLPNAHQFAELLTKAAAVTVPPRQLSTIGELSVVCAVQQEGDEAHRLERLMEPAATCQGQEGHPTSGPRADTYNGIVGGRLARRTPVV